MGYTDNDDLSSVFSGLTEIGGWMKGFNGDLPYSFTPGKSVLLVFGGIHSPVFSKNFPDVMFKGNECTLCYWQNNTNQKIAFKISDGASGGHNTKCYMKEW